ENSGWRFVSQGRDPGPWIVTGWRGEVLLCRPSLILVSGEHRGDDAAVNQMKDDLAVETARPDAGPTTYSAGDSSPPASGAEGEREQVFAPLKEIVEHPSRPE